MEFLAEGLYLSSLQSVMILSPQDFCEVQISVILGLDPSLRGVLEEVFFFSAPGAKYYANS